MDSRSANSEGVEDEWFDDKGNVLQIQNNRRGATAVDTKTKTIGRATELWTRVIPVG